MKEFLIMSLLALVMGIALLILAIVFLVQKKGGRLIVYTTLLLFPVLLIAFPNLFLTYHSMELLGNVFIAVPRTIYSINILVFVIFIILKENISPKIGDNYAKVPSDDRKILAGMRLVQYSLLMNIVYITPVLFGITYCVFAAVQAPNYATGNSLLDLFASIFVWALILFLPAAQYYVMVIILAIYFLILIILMLATAINGVVRITTAKSAYSKYTGLYIVMMFIPGVNLISMLLLCYLSNRELKNDRRN